MSARRVLLIHPLSAERARLRAILGETGNQYVEASSRKEAGPLLSPAPSLVVSHHADFKKLIADLERKAPGATRERDTAVGNEARAAAARATATSRGAATAATKPARTAASSTTTVAPVSADATPTISEAARLGRVDACARAAREGDTEARCA